MNNPYCLPFISVHLQEQKDGANYYPIHNQTTNPLLLAQLVPVSAVALFELPKLQQLQSVGDFC